MERNRGVTSVSEAGQRGDYPIDCWQRAKYLAIFYTEYGSHTALV